jgi:hypothetical protein
MLNVRRWPLSSFIVHRAFRASFKFQVSSFTMVKCQTSLWYLGVFVALLVCSLGMARAAELHPKSGAIFATTWVVSGDIPVPVIAAVLLGL